MAARTPKFTTNLTLGEMEALIRRIVKEAVHEEFERILQEAPASIAGDWAHEGADDPAGDRALLAEALLARARHRTDPEEWIDLEAFKAELSAAEAAGELPD